ncbi:hypothetical protein RHGRI_005764 [Rhododendron griersonianum]|uniref:CCHC-type domain-containing protein n=1 Tax=Rhododendron griersonianum TaxID=479676 RepID=A0AAV6LEL1_9ERIC|nr:hypothetical protein RHGRI_005764 [Rhododendron griersonianum]
MVTSQRLYVFLAGLDSHLDGVRGRILATAPLPNLQAAYAIVCAEANRQDAMLNITPSDGGVVMSIRKSISHDSKKGIRKCIHCNGDNHFIETCFKLHGYPEWHPKVEDPDGRGKLAKFIRVRVWIDITKPLKKGFFLRRNGEEDLWIKFQYERLSDFCYWCGRVGHTINDCPEQGSSNRLANRFDSSLRAETSWLDTFQYGDKQLEKLFYPHTWKIQASGGGKEGSVEEEGGACEEIGSVIAKGTNSTTGSCEEAEHVEAGQVSLQGEGSSTSKTNPYSNLSGELAFFKNPSNQGILDLGVVSKTPFGPFPSLNVERPISSGPQYFVEEPSSPRVSEKAVSENWAEMASILPSSPKAIPIVADVSLSSIFNRLNLKRKFSVVEKDADLATPLPSLGWKEADSSVETPLCSILVSPLPFFNP